jgi:hypothetical protein
VAGPEPATAHGRTRRSPSSPAATRGFNRINELNDRLAAFIKADATGNQAA